jgi:hypothetical protein
MKCNELQGVGAQGVHSMEVLNVWTCCVLLAFGISMVDF